MEQNNPFSLEYLPYALNDMTEIISSYIMFGIKQGAIKVKDSFNKAAQQISAFPYSGIAIPDDKLAKFNFRMIIVGKYLMFYRVFENEHKVIFYRVLNGKRNYPTLLSRFMQEAGAEE